MDEVDLLAGQFETHRGHLRSVAYRMLGTLSEADDAVQETWLRLSRADAGDVANLRGWLTTVVARVCLDMLRSRQSRREQPLALDGDVSLDAADPEREALLAEAVGVAMLAVLQRLAPAERVAFVLHDVFGVPFEEIAGIVGRSPVAARQLASRGRRRVQGAPADDRAETVARQQSIVEAFLRAARDGDFEALLAVLAPDVVLRGDEAALRMGVRSGWLTQAEVHGATAVARQFAGRAQAAQPALIDGAPGAVWAPGGVTRVAFTFTVAHGQIVAIALRADPGWLRQLDVVLAGA